MAAHLRLVLFFLGGVLVALTLFFVMNQLIRGDGVKQAALTSGGIVGLVRVKQSEQVRAKQRVRPMKPPPPKQPPPPPKAVSRSKQQPMRAALDIAFPDIDLPATGGGPYLGAWNAGETAAEGDAVPIVRIDPQWPREALEQGLEGYVLLEVLIGTDGSARDVKVIESKPGSLFVRNSIRAVLRWKFKPRIVDGVAVERWARTTIEFELVD